MFLGQFLWDFEVPSCFFYGSRSDVMVMLCFQGSKFVFLIVLGGLTWFFMSPCLVFMILGGF